MPGRVSALIRSGLSKKMERKKSMKNQKFFIILVLGIISVFTLDLYSQEIHNASKQGNIEKLKTILSENPGLLDAEDSKGFTPVHSAVVGGKEDVVKFLIDKGADLNIRNKNGLTPVFTAIDRGRNNIAKVLIENGADINIKGYRGSTLLHMAARGGDSGLAQVLLDKGAKINVRDSRGNTPLHMAFESNQLENRRFGLIKMLVDNGADVNAKNSAGSTPFILTVQKNFSEIALYMIEKSKDKMEVFPNGKSLLHWAASAGKTDLVETLLKNGADKNENTADGKTPLYYAVKYGNKETIDILNKYGADRSSIDENNPVLPEINTPLDIGEAVIWHTGHSGWVVKTRNYLLIFDYAFDLWKSDKGNPDVFLSNGYLDPGKIRKFDTYVFVTHFHGDHYDKSIHEWEKTVDNINYIFGWPSGKGENCLIIEPRGTGSIGNIEIYTINAEHPGVGFLVKADGLTIYHAGDHGIDRRRLGKRYTDEIDYLSSIENKINIAFIPVVFEKGIHYTIEKLNLGVLFPMHSWGREHQYTDFVMRNSGKYLNTQIAAAEFRGQRFFYKNTRIR